MMTMAMTVAVVVVMILVSDYKFHENRQFDLMYATKKAELILTEHQVCRDEWIYERKTLKAYNLLFFMILAE